MDIEEALGLLMAVALSGDPKDFAFRASDPKIDTAFAVVYKMIAAITKSDQTSAIIGRAANSSFATAAQLYLDLYAKHYPQG